MRVCAGGGWQWASRSQADVLQCSAPSSGFVCSLSDPGEILSSATPPSVPARRRSRVANISMHHRLRRAPTTAHCPRCAGPASCSVRVTREGGAPGWVARPGRRERCEEGREVDAAQPDDGGLMCAPLPVNGGQCCRCRMVGIGGLSCTWRVEHWEPRVGVGGIQDPHRH